MLTIEQVNFCPNSTYFNNSDVMPDLEDYILKIYTGRGSYHSWGAPGNESTVVLNTEDLVAIHVGYHHKYQGSQFWCYYTTDKEGVWKKVSWGQLSDPLRHEVLLAYEDKKAPSYAKIPGKLRDQYESPTLTTYTTYKIVQVIDGRYYSVYDGVNTEYIIGKRLAQKAIGNHSGGYYSYPTETRLMHLFHSKDLFNEKYYEESRRLAILECEISGTIIKYDNGKYASTYLRPMREINQFEYVCPAEQEDEKVG